MAVTSWVVRRVEQKNINAEDFLEFVRGKGVSDIASLSEQDKIALLSLYAYEKYFTNTVVTNLSYPTYFEYLSALIFSRINPLLNLQNKYYALQQILFALHNAESYFLNTMHEKYIERQEKSTETCTSQLSWEY